MSKKRLIMSAYRRNIRLACQALGTRVPNGYQTYIADNGDFIVSSSGKVVGRLSKENVEVFVSEKPSK